MNQNTELRIISLVGCIILIVGKIFMDKISFPVQMILLAVLIFLLVRAMKIMKNNRKNRKIN